MYIIYIYLYIYIYINIYTSSLVRSGFVLLRSGFILHAANDCVYMTDVAIIRGVFKNQ